MLQKYLVRLLTVLILLSAGNSFSSETPGTTEPARDTEKLYFDVETPDAADDIIAEHLREVFPIISDFDIRLIASSKSVTSSSKHLVDSGKAGDEVQFYRVSFDVPKHFLVDTAKILWELNIPEYKSRIYQLYKGNKIYIDTWPNVVGTIKDKTYTGNFEAYRVRNWPFYKDPDPKKAHIPPVKPGPGNPLGLFVVHFDSTSLRYFHGTNKNDLLYTERRSLSHGCIRNDNDNIEKMKQFLIKRVIKSKDLSGWLGSKKTLIYDFEPVDRFPVRIIYKTFNMDIDEYGYYVEMFDDIYKYSNRGNIDPERDTDSLVMIADEDMIRKEFNSVYKSHGIPDSALNVIIEYLLNSAARYERHYIKDLKEKFML